jgi:hypothetical protein
MSQRLSTDRAPDAVTSVVDWSMGELTLHTSAISVLVCRSSMGELTSATSVGGVGSSME